MLINYRKRSRSRETERYIRSLNPTLYIPFWKRDGSTFVSDDGSGITCTATGASRTQQGRTFDGDDWVSIGTPSTITGLSKGSILTWVKLAALTDDASLVRWGGDNVANPGYFTLFVDLQGGNYYASLAKADDGQAGAQAYVRGGTALTAGQWYLIETGSSGTAYYIRLNGIPETITVVYGADNGDWFADVVLGTPQNIGIGAGYYDGSVVAYLQGTIGDHVVMPRGLTTNESREFYERTKWRYK